MFSETYSTKEKPILIVSLMKIYPKSRWNPKMLLSMPLIHVFDWIDDFRQLWILTSWSTDNPNLFKGRPVAISWTSCFWSNHQALDECLIRILLYCWLLGETTCASKKTKQKKKNSPESASDQTTAKESACDQTSVWSKLPLVRPSQTEVPDHCPDKSALEVFSRTSNSSAPRTCVRSKMVWSEVTSVWPPPPGNFANFAVQSQFSLKTFSWCLRAPHWEN